MQQFGFKPNMKHMFNHHTLNVFAPESKSLLRKANIITMKESLAEEFIWNVEYTGESAPIPYSNAKSSGTAHD